MLSSEAHSFRRKAALAILLSWVGGFTNVIALLTCGETVSHQTGNTTHLGVAIGELLVGNANAVAELSLAGLMVVMFFVGSAASGLLTDWAKRSGRSAPYIAPIAIEAILLSIVVLVLVAFPDAAGTTAGLRLVVGLACAAMGLQNGTITRISGSVVRTTHLTGVITDIGLESAHMLGWVVDYVTGGSVLAPRSFARAAWKESSTKRLVLLLAIFGSFLSGVVIGAITEMRWGAAALLLPIIFLTLLLIQQMIFSRRIAL